MHGNGDLVLAPLELLLAQGACNTVLPRVEELLKRAQQQGRERERVELHLVACEAHRRLSNEPRARRHLALAISIAAPGGLMHPFKANSLMLTSLDESTFGFVRKVEKEFLQRLRVPGAPWMITVPPDQIQTCSEGPPSTQRRHRRFSARLTALPRDRLFAALVTKTRIL